jgi:hypothetical protein
LIFSSLIIFFIAGDTVSIPEIYPFTTNADLKSLALHHFLPLIKKSRYKPIIRTDNTTAMYNINRKLGAMNLYRVSGRYGNYPKKIA